MPCEEIIQVVGTLIPQDKESFGSVSSHEENAIFIFEESRTLLSNQLAQGKFLKMKKQQFFRKEPCTKKTYAMDYLCQVFFRCIPNHQVYFNTDMSIAVIISNRNI
ncbi:hypothetical protein ACTWQL_20955 [Pseudalkalibacillus sp. R45]|uniref:hypothetical protein n=1 Tax=Pseudalkalibacillus sp. R45 TaxID=3457433 RepID=UPI003FCDE382